MRGHPGHSPSVQVEAGVAGRRAVLWLPRRRCLTGLHHQVGAYDTDSLIGALEGLRRFLGGQKATLLWDGLPAHRSKAMSAWLCRQRHWLVVEQLPGYAPELNPVEALWADLKGVELVNLAGETLETSSRRSSRASSGSARHITWPTHSFVTAA
jgi:hypothetical protein